MLGPFSQWDHPADRAKVRVLRCQYRRELGVLGQICRAQCCVNDSSLIAVEIVDESQKLICPRCLQYGIVGLDRVCSPSRYACAIATRPPGANEVFGSLLEQAKRETKLGPRHWQPEQTKAILKTR